MNQPYVKGYDARTGELLNPITTRITNKFANRQQRRLYLQKRERAVLFGEQYRKQFINGKLIKHEIR